VGITKVWDKRVLDNFDKAVLRIIIHKYAKYANSLLKEEVYPH
jgi:hypothetical protein